MPIRKITKRVVSGNLLIQFKYAEEDSWTLNSSQTTFQTIGGVFINMTPQYADSILEVSVAGSLRSQNSSNTHDQFAFRLLVNNSEEYIQSHFLGQSPYGNNHSHSGGRNDRTAPTRRTGHVTNQATTFGFSHAYIPASTNAQRIETQTRNISSARNSLLIQDFFMITKEIGIPAIGGLSGPQ
jgi:hypothetical protein